MLFGPVPPRIEGRVHRAVGIETDNILPSLTVEGGEFTRDQDLSVRLDGHRPDRAGGAQARVEGSVQAAIRIEPRDPVALNAVVGRHQTADDNPATAVQRGAGDAGQTLVNAVSDSGLGVKAGVDRAVRIEAGDVIAIGAVVAGEVAADDGLIIRLQHHRVHQRVGPRRGIHRRLAIQLVVRVEKLIYGPGGIIQHDVGIESPVERHGIVIVQYGHNGLADFANCRIVGRLRNRVQPDNEIPVEIRHQIVGDRYRNRFRSKVAFCPSQLAPTAPNA